MNSKEESAQSQIISKERLLEQLRAALSTLNMGNFSAVPVPIDVRAGGRVTTKNITFRSTKGDKNRLRRYIEQLEHELRGDDDASTK